MASGDTEVDAVVKLVVNCSKASKTFFARNRCNASLEVGGVWGHRRGKARVVKLVVKRVVKLVVKLVLTLVWR